MDERVEGSGGFATMASCSQARCRLARWTVENDLKLLPHHPTVEGFGKVIAVAVKTYYQTMLALSCQIYCTTTDHPPALPFPRSGTLYAPVENGVPG